MIDEWILSVQILLRQVSIWLYNGVLVGHQPEVKSKWLTEPWVIPEEV